MSALDARPRGGVPAWLRKARAAADRPPASPRDPLLLGAGGHAIGSVEPELAAAMVAGGLPIARRKGGWTVVGAPDASLAAVAAWLLDRPLGLRRRGELLPVVDAAGRTLAGIERGVVRVLGLRTFAVHLSGRAADGRCWVQQRAFDKATDPGKWDTLMGGQMALGESIDTTLERETGEEAGLALAQFVDLARAADVVIRRPVAEGWMDERIAVFRAVLPDDATPSNRDGEVVRFACVDEATLRRDLAAGEFTLEATLILGAELAPGEAGRA